MSFWDDAKIWEVSNKVARIDRPKQAPKVKPWWLFYQHLFSRKDWIDDLTIYPDILGFDYDMVPRSSNLGPRHILLRCLLAAFYMWINRCKILKGTYQTTKSIFDFLNPMAEDSVVFTRTFLNAMESPDLSRQPPTSSNISMNYSTLSIPSSDDQSSGGVPVHDLTSLRLTRPPENGQERSLVRVFIILMMMVAFIGN